MRELSENGVVSFRCEGEPPVDYDVMFSEQGLALSAEGELTLRSLHRAHVYLHLDYPRRPPVVTWQTPVFHPNLLGPEQHGGVCIGSWSASEGLDDLCVRLSDLVSYRAFNVADALNTNAAHWIRGIGASPGISVDRLLAQRPTGQIGNVGR